MAISAVALVMAPHMAGQQPMHPSAKIAIHDGPEYEVEVVWHQAPSGYPHGYAIARLAH
jgi:hypothetical protein